MLFTSYQIKKKGNKQKKKKTKTNSIVPSLNVLI